jgi:uncharacterized BrkB/YihY/UPF0761 family membrane protein
MINRNFIGLMIWFYLLSFILILGFEINASIDEARQAVLVVSVEKTPARCINNPSIS